MLQFHSPAEAAAKLAGLVRQERLTQGWTQRTLAERAGVALPTLNRYERTGRTSVENLLRLCHALGRLDDLVAALTPGPASSLAELEQRSRALEPRSRSRAPRRRGTQ